MNPVLSSALPWLNRNLMALKKNAVYMKIYKFTQTNNKFMFIHKVLCLILIVEPQQYKGVLLVDRGTDMIMRLAQLMQ